MASAKAQAEALRVNMHYDKIFDWQKAKVGCDVQWMKGEAPDVTTTAQPKEEPASAMKSKERRLKPKTKLPAMTVDDMKKQVPLHVAPQVHQRNILKRFPAHRDAAHVRGRDDGAGAASWRRRAGRRVRRV